MGLHEGGAIGGISDVSDPDAAAVDVLPLGSSSPDAETLTDAPPLRLQDTGVESAAAVIREEVGKLVESGRVRPDQQDQLEREAQAFFVQELRRISRLPAVRKKVAAIVNVREAVRAAMSRIKDLAAIF